MPENTEESSPVEESSPIDNIINILGSEDTTDEQTRLSNAIYNSLDKLNTGSPDNMTCDVVAENVQDPEETTDNVPLAWLYDSLDSNPELKKKIKKYMFAVLGGFILLIGFLIPYNSFCKMVSKAINQKKNKIMSQAELDKM